MQKHHHHQHHHHRYNHHHDGHHDHLDDTSVAVVLVSLCGMCFNTFPWMMVGRSNIIMILSDDDDDDAHDGHHDQYHGDGNLFAKVKDIHGEPVDNPRLGMMEAVCISFFTIEFLLR